MKTTARLAPTDKSPLKSSLSQKSTLTQSPHHLFFSKAQAPSSLHDCILGNLKFGLGDPTSPPFNTCEQQINQYLETRFPTQKPGI